MSVEAITRAIVDVPDFPKPGVVFKDLSPIWLDPGLFSQAVALFVDRLRGRSLDKVAAAEARGFVFGAVVAHELGLGFVPIRKKGKLPRSTRSVTYELEYGSAVIEVHQDAVSPGERVVLLDDLLATGGTAAAAASLLQELGAKVTEIDFLVELSFLNGRSRLAGFEVFAPIVF
jgi:adenine phosphoribosyltransferase